MLFMSSILFAQDEDFNSLLKRNELKLNIPTTIFGSFPEISYERVLNSDISAGVALGVGTSSYNDYDLGFAFTPHFRWFFGGNCTSMQKFSTGFFIEVNGSLFTKESGGGAGMGMAFGWKYLSKNNWVCDVVLGGGRDFTNNFGGYQRFGISIGKRF